MKNVDYVIEEKIGNLILNSLNCRNLKELDSIVSENAEFFYLLHAPHEKRFKDILINFYKFEKECKGVDNLIWQEKVFKPLFFLYFEIRVFHEIKRLKKNYEIQFNYNNTGICLLKGPNTICFTIVNEMVVFHNIATAKFFYSDRSFEFFLATLPSILLEQQDLDFICQQFNK